jgi:hypothetical protein
LSKYIKFRIQKFRIQDSGVVERGSGGVVEWWSDGMME